MVGWKEVLCNNPIWRCNRCCVKVDQANRLWFLWHLRPVSSRTPRGKQGIYSQDMLVVWPCAVSLKPASEALWWQKLKRHAWILEPARLGGVVRTGKPDYSWDHRSHVATGASWMAGWLILCPPMNATSSNSSHVALLSLSLPSLFHLPGMPIPVLP